MNDKIDTKTTIENVRQEIDVQLDRIATIENKEQLPTKKCKPWWKRIFSK